MLAFALAALVSIAPLPRHAEAEEASAVRYTIGAIETDELVELVIEMEFTGSAGGETRLQLPRDRYGTPDLDKAVVELEVVGDAILEPGKTRSRRLLRHAPSEPLTLLYRLAYDPSRNPGSAYRPEVGKNHFQFLGPQWMVRFVGDDEANARRAISIVFADWPEGWAAFSSLGVGPDERRTTASFEEMVPSVLGGGAYERKSFAVGDEFVHAFLAGSFEAGNAEIFDSIGKIVTYQRQRFGAEGMSHLVVTMNARSGLRAGTSIRDAMICFVAESAPLADLQLLLAHEMFHQWLPLRARVAADDFEARYDWFDEGATEYFARRLLLDQGLWTEDAYVALFNRDLRELARNPHHRLTNDELFAVHEEGKFTNIHYRLSYLRGALIALHWNAAVERNSDGSRSFVDTMADFVEAARSQTDGEMSADDFYALLEADGIAAGSDIETWIEYADPIQPDSQAFGPDWEMEPTDIPVLDFRVEDSRRRGLILGVVEGSSASKAGLQNYQPLRFIRPDRAKDQVIVGVTVDGEEREMLLQPSSWQVVPQYQRR